MYLYIYNFHEAYCIYIRIHPVLRTRTIVCPNPAFQIALYKFRTNFLHQDNFA
jgi:hypothetical protein